MGTKRKIKASTVGEAITIGEALEDFIQEKEARGRVQATLDNYTLSLRLFMECCELTENDTTDEITLQDVYHWIGRLKKEDKKPSSINHYLRDLRTFLYWCMEETRGYINPPFKVKLVEAQEEEIKHFTDEDLERLLVKPRRNDSFVQWRTWAIVSWVLGTGNRAETICNIRLSDISFSRREITLRHTKNKKAQILPLSSALETALKEYIRMWRRDADIDAYLFCNIGDEKLTANALKHAFAKYCQGRGVQQTNIHGLRHNFAKGWVKANGNMYALQKVLGHSSLDMTKKYVRLFSDDIKDDYDKFATLNNFHRASKRKQTVKRSMDW